MSTAARVARTLASRRQRRSARPTRDKPASSRRRPDASRCGLSRTASRRGRSPRATRSRTPSRRSRRLVAPPTPCSTCSPSPLKQASHWTSTTSTPSARARRSSPTSGPAAASSRPTSFAAGGLGVLMQRHPRLGLLHGDAHDRQRADDRRGRRRGQRNARPGGDSCRRRAAPPHGGIAVLRGNLAAEGCVVKLAGNDRDSHRGPARVFDSEEEAFAAVRDGTIQAGDVVVIRYEGPVRRTRHARDARRDRCHRRCRSRRFAWH